MDITIDRSNKRKAILESNGSKIILTYDVNIESVVPSKDYASIIFESTTDDLFLNNVVAVDSFGKMVWQIEVFDFQDVGFVNVAVENGLAKVWNFGGFWAVYKLGSWEFVEKVWDK